MDAENHFLTGEHGSKMSRGEFCQSWSQCRRRLAWAMCLVVLGFLILLWVISLIVIRMNRAGVLVDSPWRPLLCVPLVLFTFGGIGFVCWLNRNPLLKCPGCKQFLTEGRAPFLAMATGRCSNCGTTLFADDFAQDPGDAQRGANQGLISRSDLVTAEAITTRSAVWPTARWALFGGMLLANGSLTGLWLKDVLAPSLGEIWTPFVMPLMTASGIAILLWTCVVWSRHSSVAIPCPQCAAEITPRGFATMTGNCASAAKQPSATPSPECRRSRALCAGAVVAARVPKPGQTLS